MDSKDPLHGKGPVFRTLTEIAALPESERLAALIERLDLLDTDEINKVGTSKSGREYSMTSNVVRKAIVETGKEWLCEMAAQGKPTGRLAGLAVFNGGANKKAG